ncbi:hypothetical protein [Streptomyces sp. NPDC005407]|uniref:hypothetical protein n=1 Tax=Streptomyces sp. NPDC005407 TaxID=3155340 RepID=UPI0033B04247
MFLHPTITRGTSRGLSGPTPIFGQDGTLRTDGRARQHSPSSTVAAGVVWPQAPRPTPTPV